MVDLIDVSAAIRDEIDMASYTYSSVSEVYANQKTIDFLKSIDEDGGDFDGDDWHVDEDYEDYVFMVHFRVVVELGGYFMDTAYGSRTFKVNPETNVITFTMG